MSDDFDRLRRTMAELAEHGGSADLYERTLRTSRRLTRRRTALAGGAVAVAVLGLGVPVALAGRYRDASPPTAPAPPPASPSPVRPSGSPVTPERPSTPVTTQGTSRSPSSGCPVSAAALRRVAGLPDDWRIDAGSISCVQGWAQGRPEAPTEAEQGDGMVLFRYADGTWQKVAEGSAVDCATHGLPERIGRRLSACYYE
jgi:hypothetical protein